MKRHLVIASLAAVILACAAWFAFNYAKGKGPLHFEQSRISLGTLERSQAVPVTFKVINDSGQPIKISSVDGVCRCTSVVTAPEEIQAHGRGVFEFLFSAARSDPGPVTKMVTIDAEGQDTLVGTFTATIK